MVTLNIKGFDINLSCTCFNWKTSPALMAPTIAGVPASSLISISFRYLWEFSVTFNCKKIGQIQQGSGGGGRVGQLYSDQVVYVVEPVNSVFSCSNNVDSVFSSQSQGHIFIIAKLQLMSSAAPSEMVSTYKKHRASTATWRNRVPKQTFLGYENPWKRKQILLFVLGVILNKMMALRFINLYRCCS